MKLACTALLNPRSLQPIDHKHPVELPPVVAPLLASPVQPLEQDFPHLIEELIKTLVVPYHPIVVVITPKLHIQKFNDPLQPKASYTLTPDVEALQGLPQLLP